MPTWLNRAALRHGALSCVVISALVSGVAGCRLAGDEISANAAQVAERGGKDPPVAGATVKMNGDRSEAQAGGPLAGEGFSGDTRAAAAAILGVAPEELVLRRRYDRGYTIADSFEGPKGLSCTIDTRTGAVESLRLGYASRPRRDPSELLSREAAVEKAMAFLSDCRFTLPEGAYLAEWRGPNFMGGNAWSLTWRYRRQGVELNWSTSVVVDSATGQVIGFTHGCPPLPASLTPTINATLAIQVAREYAKQYQVALDDKKEPLITLAVAFLPRYPEQYQEYEAQVREGPEPETVKTLTAFSKPYLVYRVQLMQPTPRPVRKDDGTVAWWYETPELWVYVDAGTGEVLDSWQKPTFQTTKPPSE